MLVICGSSCVVVPPTKHIVPPAPPTDSHPDDRTPVVQATGPPELQAAGREYRRDPDQVLTAHHLGWARGRVERSRPGRTGSM
jgi:hypothetical protein